MDPLIILQHSRLQESFRDAQARDIFDKGLLSERELNFKSKSTPWKNE